MLTTGNLRPRGLSTFGTRLFDVLEAHVVSPWHLLASTCSRKGIDPLAMTAHDLVQLAPLLSEQVARVTDERHGLRLMHALQALANTP